LLYRKRAICLGHAFGFSTPARCNRTLNISFGGKEISFHNVYITSSNKHTKLSAMLMSKERERIIV
jgi:hypothetical protein